MCLALTGKQSKGSIESVMYDRAHADVVIAFTKLEQKNLIRRRGYKPYTKGRKQYFYDITFDGLKLLIVEDSDVLKFWKVLFGCCHYWEEWLDPDKVEELCNLFMQKYLKYGNHDFFYQIDIFDNMRDQWLEYASRHNKPSLMQKIIETLALHPRIDVRKLSRYTGEAESKVKRCLADCSLDCYRPVVENTKYIYQNVVGKGKNRKYQDFLFHTIVTSRQSGYKDAKNYELSLFGVILALSQVRYNDAGKLNPGLYYNNITLAEYYDKIASNYRNKLPLVFGKWRFLKNILRIFSYYNFDIILDKEVRKDDSHNLSVIRGGNKELTDSLKEIVLQTRQQIGKFADTGSYLWLNYPGEMKYRYEGRDKQRKADTNKDNGSGIDRPEPNRVAALINKIREITIVLNPLEYTFPDSKDSLTEFFKELSSYLEISFANEIYSLYYFNLFYDYEFHSMLHSTASYYSSISQEQSFTPKSMIPKYCLSLILSKDKKEPQVIHWMNPLIQDIIKLQNETSNALNFKI